MNPMDPGPPIITDQDDADRFEELARKLLKLQKEAAAVQEQLDKLLGSESDPGFLWTTIEKYGTVSKENATSRFVLHKDIEWNLSKTTTFKYDEARAVQLVELSQEIMATKPKSDDRLRRFGDFKTLCGETGLTDKQLWTQVETLSVMLNCGLLRMQNVLNRDVWRLFEQDADFKFPSVLMSTRREFRRYAIAGNNKSG